MITGGRENRSPVFTSIKLHRGRGLLRTHSPCRDCSTQIVFSSYGRASQPAKHRDLPDVRQRVCDGALKKLFTAATERRLGRDVCVKCLKRGEETLRALIPRQRSGVVLFSRTIGQGQAPVQQIADVAPEFAPACVWHYQRGNRRISRALREAPCHRDTRESPLCGGAIAGSIQQPLLRFLCPSCGNPITAVCEGLSGYVKARAGN